MTTFNPDTWVVFRVTGDITYYRILAGWNGGYLHGDSWRMSSGIKSVSVDGNYLVFTNHSGSTYHCHKEMYGLRRSNAGAWYQLEQDYGDRVAILDEDTDWTTVEW